MRELSFVVTANLMEKNGKILLVQEGNPPAKGKWNFPAGKLERDVDILENTIKEAKEETGYDVRLDGLVGIYHELRDGGTNPVIIVFKSSIVGGKLDPDKNEIMDAGWFTAEEIKKKDLRNLYILKSINDLKKRGLLQLETVSVNKMPQ
jgi:ADP-ribose pyrophosphatase YjhB (NUDIX family)